MPSQLAPRRLDHQRRVVVGVLVSEEDPRPTALPGVVGDGEVDLEQAAELLCGGVLEGIKQPYGHSIHLTKGAVVDPVESLPVIMLLVLAHRYVERCNLGPRSALGH